MKYKYKILNITHITFSAVNEFRKPIFTQPLEAQRVMQREPATLSAVCTADPLPHVSWLLNGVELTPDATIQTDADSKEIEHGLKECTFTLHIPTGWKNIDIKKIIRAIKKSPVLLNYFK